jgi:epoxyqueuosine reductase
MVMDQEEIRSIVREVCSPGIYDIGFAELDGLIKNEYSGYHYGISLLRKLDNKIMDLLKYGPTFGYYNYYNQINKELDKNVKAIELKLRKKGVDALGIAATSTDYELDNDGNELLHGKISHKMVATRSGLGWIGKTGLLISRKFGPRVRLASILLDQPVKPDFPPVVSSLCGNCNICVNACPAGACKGVLWNVNIKREEFLNADKCKEKCRELSRDRIDQEISLCGICISVCPHIQLN